MPNITDMVLYSVASGVTDATFTFRSEKNGSYRFVKGGTSKESDITITLTRAESDTVTRVRCAIAYPIVVDTGTGGVYVPEVVRTLRSNLEFILPNGSTEPERHEILKFMNDMNYDQHPTSLLPAMVRDLEGLY